MRGLSTESSSSARGRRPVHMRLHNPDAPPDPPADPPKGVAVDEEDPQDLTIHTDPFTEEKGRPSIRSRRPTVVTSVGGGDAPATPASGAARRISKCESFCNAMKTFSWGSCRAFVGHGVVGLTAANTVRYFTQEVVESEQVRPELAALTAAGAVIFVGMSAGAHSGELIFHRLVAHEGGCVKKCGLIFAKSAGALASGVLPLVACVMLASVSEKQEGNDASSNKLMALAMLPVLARMLAQVGRDISNVTLFQGVAGRTVPRDEKGLPLAGKDLMRFQFQALLPAMLLYALTAVVHQAFFKWYLTDGLAELLTDDSESLLAAANFTNFTSTTNATNATNAMDAAAQTQSGGGDATVRMVAFALSSLVLELLDEFYQPLSFFAVATCKGYRLGYEKGKGVAQLKANVKALFQGDNWSQIWDHTAMRIFGFAMPEALASFATIDVAHRLELLIAAGVMTGPVELRSHFATCGASIKAAKEEAIYELEKLKRANNANPGSQERAARTLDPQTATPNMAADLHFAQDRQQEHAAMVKSVTATALGRMRESVSTLVQTMEALGVPEAVLEPVQEEFNNYLLRNINDIEDAETIAAEAGRLAAFSALDINPAGFEALRERLDAQLPPPGEQAEPVDVRSRDDSMDPMHNEDEAPPGTGDAGRLAPVEMEPRSSLAEADLRQVPGTRRTWHRRERIVSLPKRSSPARPQAGPPRTTAP